MFTFKDSADVDIFYMRFEPLPQHTVFIGSYPGRMRGTHIASLRSGALLGPWKRDPHKSNK